MTLPLFGTSRDCVKYLVLTFKISQPLYKIFLPRIYSIIQIDLSKVINFSKDRPPLQAAASATRVLCLGF